MSEPLVANTQDLAQRILESVQVFSFASYLRPLGNESIRPHEHRFTTCQLTLLPQNAFCILNWARGFVQLVCIDLQGGYCLRSLNPWRVRFRGH